MRGLTGSMLGWRLFRRPGRLQALLLGMLVLPVLLVGGFDLLAEKA